MKNNKKGFTLVELVIVIAVIAILASVLIPTFSGIIQRAKESARVHAVTSARDEFYSSNEKFVSPADMNGYVFKLEDNIYVVEDGVITLDNERDMTSYRVIDSEDYISNGAITIYAPGRANARTYDITVYVNGCHYEGDLTANYECESVSYIEFEKTNAGLVLKLDDDTKSFVSDHYNYEIYSRISTTNNEYSFVLSNYNSYENYIMDISALHLDNNVNELNIEVEFRDLNGYLVINKTSATGTTEIVSIGGGENTEYSVSIEVDQYERITALTIQVGNYTYVYDANSENYAIGYDILWGEDSYKAELIASDFENVFHTGNTLTFNLVTTNVVFKTSESDNDQTDYCQKTSFYYTTEVMGDGFTCKVNSYLNGELYASTYTTAAYSMVDVRVNGVEIGEGVGATVDLSENSFNVITVNLHSSADPLP